MILKQKRNYIFFLFSILLVLAAIQGIAEETPNAAELAGGASSAIVAPAPSTAQVGSGTIGGSVEAKLPELETKAASTEGSEASNETLPRPESAYPVPEMVFQTGLPTGAAAETTEDSSGLVDSGRTGVENIWSPTEKPDGLYEYAKDVVAAVGVGVRTGGNGGEEVQPLKILSADLKPGVVGTPYSDTINVVGGTPPYQISATGLPPDFILNSATGAITGTAKVASENKIIVTAIDAARMSQRRFMELTIRTTPIFISSSSIGQAVIAEPFATRLVAQGGKPPYVWSISGGRLPTGLSLSSDGMITGAAAEEFSGVVRVMVQDDDKGVDQADLPIIISAAKAPEAPASSAAIDDTKPDVSPAPTDPEKETPSTDDGTTPTTLPDTSNNPPVEDNGNGGGAAATSKVKLFVTAPSNGKVGLAWQVAGGFTVKIYRSTETHPLTIAEGELACKGDFQARTNCVDGDLENGRTYYYSAFAISDGGTSDDATPVKSEATPNFVTLTGLADPFVDEVVEFRPLDPQGCFNCNHVNQAVVGPPQGKGEIQGSYDVVAIGAKVNSDNGASAPYGGSITVRFTNNIIVNGPNIDFTVFENPIRLGDTDTYFVEPAVVDVSADGVNFFRFPFNFVPHYDAAGKLNLGNPLCYVKGFAGIKPVYSYLGAPDPTKPNLSGGDQFDLSDLPTADLSWIQYVRITATGDNWLTDENGDLVRHSNESPTFGASGKGNSGFDFDAIAAVNY